MAPGGDDACHCAMRDLEFSRSLNPGQQTFSQCLEHNKSRLPLG